MRTKRIAAVFVCMSAVAVLAPVAASATPYHGLGSLSETSKVSEMVVDTSHAVQHSLLQEHRVSHFLEHGQNFAEITAHTSPHVFVKHVGHHHK